MLVYFCDIHTLHDKRSVRHTLLYANFVTTSTISMNYILSIMDSRENKFNKRFVYENPVLYKQNRNVCIGLFNVRNRSLEAVFTPYKTSIVSSDVISIRFTQIIPPQIDNCCLPTTVIVHFIDPSEWTVCVWGFYDFDDITLLKLRRRNHAITPPSIKSTGWSLSSMSVVFIRSQNCMIVYCSIFG